MSLPPQHSFPPPPPPPDVQMDDQQQQQQPPPPPPPSQSEPPTPSTPVRKRKKGDNGEPAPPAEPRRLRRSHEACARCRNKKIKCDSKHPRCTACATAGTPCHQEDRHRQTLTPRGYTERLERQIAQCDLLLKHHIPGFELPAIEDHLIKANLPVEPPAEGAPSAAFQFQNGPPPPAHPFPPPPPGHMMPPGYPGMPPYGYPPPGPPGTPYPPHMMPPPPHMYPPGIHPAFQPPPPGTPLPPPPGTPQQQPQQPPSQHGSPSEQGASANGANQGPSQNNQSGSSSSAPPQASPTQDAAQAPTTPALPEGIPPGADPRFNNLADDRALAKAFGVSPPIIQGLRLGPHESEDIAILGQLISNRDQTVAEGAEPREPSMWVEVTGDGVGGQLWLPKDRTMTGRIVRVYFERLNFHRPVFLEREFVPALDALYAGAVEQYDPGFVCAVYLVLALGTLSELSHRACGLDRQAKEKQEPGPSAMNAVKKLMPADWPEHEEFFHRALAVKPELRVTVSSLQALILLHWYLYTERQGRTLWRLVGSLVRLGIELGLNHDPTTQQIFSETECRLRIRLWGIVLVHDRGTSIQLGRPLAIAPNDSATPQPTAPKSGKPDVSDHFLYSPPIAEIQADIIQSLYSPQVLTADQIQRHATRIVKSMVEFRSRLPERYKYYFGGTEEWPLERRYRIVQDISADDGLTLLKIGITRIFLLRALFSSKDLPYPARRRALVDAIVVSHNIIVAHHQLIRFPDIAFFVSPIPLHIAAMVILYGHMSRCEALPRQVALEDVWMALDMLPSFRWRWERKDHNGGHPLIARLAERVLEVNLRQAGPTAQPILLPEMNWDVELLSPTQVHTPVPPPATAAAYYHSPSATASPSHSAGAVPNSAAGTNGNGKMPDVPSELFYPTYFDGAWRANGGGDPTAAILDGQQTGGASGGGSGASALGLGVGMTGAWGAQAQEIYMLEERDVRASGAGWERTYGGGASAQ